jgi:hypothetical protein
MAVHAPTKRIDLLFSKLKYGKAAKVRRSLVLFIV